jgi:methionine biosynthesis protein MetW
MNLADFYEEQAQARIVGNLIDSRVRVAAEQFRRYLGHAHRLLDVGCGAGAISAFLCEELGCWEVHGVDVSPSRVRQAASRSVRALVADLNSESLPFEDDHFDAVFCGEIIEHLVNPDHLLDEVLRVLKSDGLFVLTTPNLGWWLNRLALLVGWQPFSTSVSSRYEVGRPKAFVSKYGCRDHLRIFTLGALRELCAKYEYDVVEVKGMHLLGSAGGSALLDRENGALRSVVVRLVHPIDFLLAKIPSLAHTLVLAMHKGLGHHLIRDR